MTPVGATITASCPARTALAGNPSDGHGGAVVATVIPAIEATVTVRSAGQFTIGGAAQSYTSLEELDRRVRSGGFDEPQPLVLATLATLHRVFGATAAPVVIDVTTTIPRSVGLAGSSAIVIATLRALSIREAGAMWADRLRGDPALIASLALHVERDVLGIAAGLQDRVVQSFGGTVSMEFGADHQRTIGGLAAGSYRSLGSPPGPIFVACRPTAAGDSGTVHAGVESSDPKVVDAMHRAAEEARRATAAIEAGDARALAQAMDATLDLRASVMELDPAHVEMVEVARAQGAAVNYTGSGGAIAVLAPGVDAAERTAQRLRDVLGCVIFPVR